LKAASNIMLKWHWSSHKIIPPPSSFINHF
jgi:hypothetical protein